MSRQTPSFRRVKVTFNGMIHSLILDAEKDVGSLRTSVAKEVGLADLDCSKYRIFYFGQIVADDTPLSSLEADRFELSPMFDFDGNAGGEVDDDDEKVHLATKAKKSRKSTTAGSTRGAAEASPANTNTNSSIVDKALHSAAVGNSASSAAMMKSETGSPFKQKVEDHTHEADVGEELPKKKKRATKAQQQQQQQPAPVSVPPPLHPQDAVEEIELPIVVGTMAKWRGRDAPELKTHEWKCYVRGLYNQDLDEVVDKVTFELHHTFAKPLREVVHSPFEMSEVGWGEFEIQIHIKLRHCVDNQYITIPHLLSFENRPPKHHAIPPNGTTVAEAMTPNPPFKLQPLPVINEKFDTIVVRNPSSKLKASLGLFGHMQSASKHRGVSCGEEILQHYRKVVQQNASSGKGSVIATSSSMPRTINDEADVCKYLDVEEQRQSAFLDNVLKELKQMSEKLDGECDAALLKQAMATKGMSRVPRYNF